MRGSLFCKAAAAGEFHCASGGLCFYFSALLHGLSKLPPADSALRAGLEEEARSIGWDALYERLCKLTPDRSVRIEPHDRQRILRALEIYELGGELGGATERAGGLIDANVPVLKLCLFTSDRAVLHKRISHRFKRMLEQGFVEEVENLRSAFPDAQQTPAMRSVGYQQAWHYLMEASAVTSLRKMSKPQPADSRKDNLPGFETTQVGSGLMPLTLAR